MAKNLSKDVVEDFRNAAEDLCKEFPTMRMLIRKNVEDVLAGANDGIKINAADDNFR